MRRQVPLHRPTGFAAGAGRTRAGAIDGTGSGDGTVASPPGARTGQTTTGSAGSVGGTLVVADGDGATDGPGDCAPPGEPTVARATPSEIADTPRTRPARMLILRRPSSPGGPEHLWAARWYPGPTFTALPGIGMSSPLSGLVPYVSPPPASRS